MVSTLFESNEMAIEQTENQESLTTRNKENAPGELAAPRWSVVTFETVAVSNLSYSEAVKWMRKLGKQKVSGLCIITDEAAARISK